MPYFPEMRECYSAGRWGLKIYITGLAFLNNIELINIAVVFIFNKKQSCGSNYTVKL